MEKKGTNYDPGWNDPPLFTYDEVKAQLKSSKPKNILNKRISFPLDPATSTSSTPFIDPTLPPKPGETCHPPPTIATARVYKNKDIINSSSDKLEDQSSCQFNSEETLSCVIVNLNFILNSETLKIQNKNDIERRLDIMKKMWLEGKFNNDIETRLLRLSEGEIFFK
uniref:SRA1/Sec31 domain-containing protein n=1 Tax=Clastoptera arizonana TaxID=38151 RepID=A0A1B6C3G5_9HEMI